MEISLLQAILIAIAAYLGISTWFLGVGYFTVYRPLIGGTIVGLILGDVVKGMQIGAAINAVYLGFISTGGTLPSDLIAAGYIGTALAMASGLDGPEALTLLAVPLGLLGGGLWFLRMTVGSFLAHWADVFAERGDTRGVAAVNVWGGQAFLFLLYALPTFFIVYYGQGIIGDVNQLLPDRFVVALAMVGGMLPAVGIGMLLNYMGRRELIPFFLIGFLLATYLDLPLIAIGMLAFALAWIVVERQRSPEPVEDTQASTRQQRISRRDLLGSWLRWLTFSHACYNFERMQGLGFAHAMTPVIRRLYTTAQERAAALKRHLVFFNTEAQVGAMIPAAVIAMEEERASGTPISDEAINAVKAGLMGPLAGIGDSLTQGLITPILLALGIGMAQEGNVMGPILFFLLESAAIILLSYFFWMQGYRWGRQAVRRIVAAGWFKQATEGAAMMGMIVAGALTAQVVSFSLATTVTVGQQTIALQADVLDKILKGILPLTLTLFVWWLLRRRVSPVAVIGLVTLFGIDATYLGLLGWAPTPITWNGILDRIPLALNGLALLLVIAILLRRRSRS